MVQTIIYLFELPGKDPLEFTVTFDTKAEQIPSYPDNPPEWTKLSHHKCSMCTLGSFEHPCCPVALGIAELLHTFHDFMSIEPCKVSCITSERTVIKQTSIQEGISSILGLQMAISGCPVMAFFRPMARFHLPFASVDESIFRVVSCYLLKQFYTTEDKRILHLDIEDIKRQYANVKVINQAMLRRISEISLKDADRNALITLNSLGQILEMEVDANLETLAHLFA